MSDPQAYRLSYSEQPHQATPASQASQPNGFSIEARICTCHQHHAQSKGATYNPGIWLYMAFATLGILTIMVALDATSLSVALPVRRYLVHSKWEEAMLMELLR